MQRSKATGVVAAHGVPNDVDATEPEGIPKRSEVGDERLPRVVVAVSALTVTALVEHEHPVSGGADPLDDRLIWSACRSTPWRNTTTGADGSPHSWYRKRAPFNSRK